MVGAIVVVNVVEMVVASVTIVAKLAVVASEACVTVVDAVVASVPLVELVLVSRDVPSNASSGYNLSNLRRVRLAFLSLISRQVST